MDPHKEFNSECENHQVVIVGGGLAGVAAAIALRLAGEKDIIVLEAASELKEAGAGIQITPNATRILQNWDLERRLHPIAAVPKDCYMKRWSSGQVLSKINLTPGHNDQFGAAFYDLHRADLHEALIQKTIELENIDIRCSHRVQNIDFDSGVVKVSVLDYRNESAERLDQLAIKANLIVAADGLYSTCRSLLPISNGSSHNNCDAKILTIPTGDVAYRILLNRDELKGDPELLNMVDSPQVNYWVGPDSHAVSYVLRNGDLLNIVLLCPDDTPDNVSRVNGDVQEMRKKFRDWDPILCRLLAKVPSVMKWKLQIRPPADSWVHGSGKCVIIGDAAHTMLPYLSQGAAIALEDAAVLGEVVKGAGINYDSLRLFESLRKTRAEKVVIQSEHQRLVYHLPDGPRQISRDRDLSGPPRVGDHWKWRDPVFARWLYGYDYIKDVSDAIADWNF